MKNKQEMGREIVEDKIIISNPEEFEKIKSQFKEDGINNVHVLIDFDKTLTYAMTEYPSIISILRDGNYLTSDYAPRAHALYNTYHPIEIDPNIPKQEKIKAMQEWWKKHFELLIECKLNKKDIDAIIRSGKIKFREGIKEMLEFLKKKDVPIVIMSAAGLGHEAIVGMLQNANLLSDNIDVISNGFDWDEDGNIVAAKEPIIHSLNKSEVMIKDFPCFEQIKNRKNVLLIGDSVDDPGMVDGFDYNTLLKIGFLNSEIEKRLEEYKQAFDMLILNDGSIKPINQLLYETFSQSAGG